MDYSLSGADLLANSGGKGKIVLYPQLKKYKTLDELLGADGVVFLLYEFKKGYGHWGLLFRQGETVEWFDSYSYKPDGEFSFIPVDFRKINDMMYPMLTKLLYESGQPIHYNNYKMQSANNNITTCGRWVLVRWRFRGLDIDDFYKMFKHIRKASGLSFDEIVYAMTAGIGQDTG
jgi:hypothetical protein